MASGDLNIDLLKMSYVKVVDLCQSYPTPFVVCRYNAWFLRYDGGPNRPPAQKRTFQISPGIGRVAYFREHMQTTQEFLWGTPLSSYYITSMYILKLAQAYQKHMKLIVESNCSLVVRLVGSAP